jgi:hypothetical protein
VLHAAQTQVAAAEQYQPFSQQASPHPCSPSPLPNRGVGTSSPLRTTSDAASREPPHRGLELFGARVDTKGLVKINVVKHLNEVATHRSREPGTGFCPTADFCHARSSD